MASLFFSLSGARILWASNNHNHARAIDLSSRCQYEGREAVEDDFSVRKKAKQDKSDASIRQETRDSVQVQTKCRHLLSIQLSDHRTFMNSLHTSIPSFTSLAALVRRYLLFKATYRLTIENGSTLVESAAAQICFSPSSSSNIISECSSNAKIELHAWAQVLIFFFFFSA